MTLNRGSAVTLVNERASEPLDGMERGAGNKKLFVVAKVSQGGNGREDQVALSTRMDGEYLKKDGELKLFNCSWVNEVKS